MHFFQRVNLPDQRQHSRVCNDIGIDRDLKKFPQQLAGSLFLGMDTPIGPVYIAYGVADTDDSSFYLYIGPRLVF